MSLAAAAEAMGVPEALVQRAAAARAEATGSSTDDILAAWAGGGSAPTAAAPPAEEPATETSEEPAPEEAPSAPEPAQPAAAPAAQPEPAPAAAATPPPAVKDPDAAPLLVGRHERAGAMVAAVVAVVAIGAVLAALFPAQAARIEVNESIGAQPEYSTAGLEGREVYMQEGCASCHTMLVRSVVTDAGLGPVTRVQDVAPLAPDTMGVRRMGPDLSHYGSRDGVDLGTTLTFLADPASVDVDLFHQPYGYLTDQELAALAQFLVESR